MVVVEVDASQRMAWVLFNAHAVRSRDVPDFFFDVCGPGLDPLLTLRPAPGERGRGEGDRKDWGGGRFGKSGKVTNGKYERYQIMGTARYLYSS